MEKTTQQLHSSSNRKPKTLQVSLLAVAFVLLLYLASPVSSCKEEEKTSLLGFLDGLSQASAPDTSWKNDTNCCLWEGVTCNEDGSVMDISLASMGLEGHISPSLGNLTGLLRLNLSGNLLSGELPPELLWSSCIVILDVSFNKLNGEFHKLPSTHELAMKLQPVSRWHTARAWQLPCAESA
ncbi:receptor-like protein 2 isoform X3 [Sorghum bicolor]|uniref:receptor-like protein 2 isoform X3 n=1 Tax=Sorghum bicolor TaxID=4558 RepID=UPI000B426CE8|nr:receptor-like protein 2 isoform X3 [Sorghum bicolor]|eukprot:XP_021316561.1 receptor-like protein 2 isoform X3 [Sorghum bicolor]